MRRVVVISIDGMDADLVDRWQDMLPTLGDLRKTTPEVRLVSVFPPDTTPAWATVYTGLNPAEHGIINFVNIADRKDGYEPPRMNDDLFQGRTFWDVASSAGRDVCIVLPMNVYPGWQVRGLMLTRSTNPIGPCHPLEAHPSSVLEDYRPSPSKLNLIGGFAGRSQLGALLDSMRVRTHEEARLAKALLRGERWDLFFVYFSALDALQHAFWSHCDPSHPLYPGESDYTPVIKDFYEFMDQVIAELLQLVDDSTAVIVLSDHGHGARPTSVANLNEALRREGLLVPKKKHAGTEQSRWRSFLRQGIIRYVRRFGAGNKVMEFSKRFPMWKLLLAPSSGIDWERTLAYVTDLSAVKNYSYGGIRFNLESDILDADGLDVQILNMLRKLKLPGTDQPLVTWAARREDFYQGAYLERFPEILLQLDEHYGLGWDFSGELFDNRGYLHQIMPGAHRRETPVFLTRNVEASLVHQNLELMDIAPLVLQLLEV